MRHRWLSTRSRTLALTKTWKFVVKPVEHVKDCGELEDTSADNIDTFTKMGGQVLQHSGSARQPASGGHCRDGDAVMTGAEDGESDKVSSETRP